jgi:hypothetical protein
MIEPDKLQELIKGYLQEFYNRRATGLARLQLKKVLERKNPYLYKARGMQNAAEIVEEILRDYLASSDETIFGDAFFEPLARDVSGGVVSPSEGVDIAVETADRYMAIAMKSGPNIFSASQSRKQNQEFLSLKSRLTKLRKQFDPVLGHAYGRKQTPSSEARIYRHSSGKQFWEEITGDPDFYLKIIQLMDDDFISQHRKDYKAEYDKAVNRYIREFTTDFCKPDGAIDWDKLLIFNSGPRERRAPPRKQN